TYALDGFGEFITIFNTISYSDSFIDTGSNALYFPSGSGRHHTSLLPDCQDNPGMFCPSTTSSNPDGITSLSAIIEGASGFPTNEVQFQIGNFDTLTSSINNNVFSDIGGDNPTFDWGLPFFFGSNIYIGFEGTSSSLGTGPYFAY